MEMQSVADNSARAKPARRRIAVAACSRPARHLRSFAWLFFIALPHWALAQDVSVNVRLLTAARNADYDGVAKALVEGASPDARNRVGETALIIALKNDQPKLAMQMIGAGTDVNLAAVNGVTPLMAAAHAGQTDIARLLMAKGANVAPLDRLQKSAMVYAAGQGSTGVVVLLLRAGVDPNAVYVHELTALMWAAGYGKTETVRALLDAGARAELKDDRGKTALDIAREGSYAETVKLLEPLTAR
jgi:ankyrin repeat protein